MIVLLDITKDNQNTGLVFWLLRTADFKSTDKLCPVNLEYKLIPWDSLNHIAKMGRNTMFDSRYSYENYLRSIHPLKREFAMKELFYPSRNFIYGETYITIHDFLRGEYHRHIGYAESTGLKEFQNFKSGSNSIFDKVCT